MASFPPALSASPTEAVQALQGQLDNELSDVTSYDIVHARISALVLLCHSLSP
jgi:hypothetical protein